MISLVTPVEQLCKHCKQGNTSHVCTQCHADITIMTKWCNPQGRPAENYHRGLMEWTHDGETCHGVMSTDVVKSRQITDPWTVLKRAIPEEFKEEFTTDMGCYPGYLYSLLLCIIFQLKKDTSFLKIMEEKENHAGKILDVQGCHMVHPFNIELVRKLFIFEDGFEKMLKEVDITFDKRINRSSETFCLAVTDAMCKSRGTGMIEKKQRISKYSGTVWTRKFVEKNIPQACLDSFENFLEKNRGSQMNDCFAQFTSPQTAKKRKKKGKFQSPDIETMSAQNASTLYEPKGDYELRFSDHVGNPASAGQNVGPQCVGSLSSPTFFTPRRHILRQGRSSEEQRGVEYSPSRPFDSPGSKNTFCKFERDD